MKTLWNETARIEAYIFGSYGIADSLVFKANLLLDPDLAEKVSYQNKTYTIIQKYGREQVKIEIDLIHQKLFTLPEHSSFRQKIKQLFTKQ